MPASTHTTQGAPETQSPSPVQVALDAFDRTLEARLAAVLERIEADVLAPLRDQVARAVVRHEAACVEQRFSRVLGGEAPAAEAPGGGAPAEEAVAAVGESQAREELWRRVRAYRLATQEGVLDPLIACLTQLRPAVASLRRLRDAYEQIGELAAETPRLARHVEPDDVFDPEADDAFTTRVRKARARRRVRARRRRGLPAPEYAVEMRRLVEYHLRVRLAPVWMRLHEAVMQALAAPVAGLERALADWIHPVLEAETGLDDPSHRLAPAYRLDAKQEGDAPAPGGAAPEENGRVEDVVRGHAESFQRALQEVRAAMAPLGATESVAGVREAVAAAGASLRRDARRYGTFLLSREARAVEAVPSELEQTERRSGPAWEAWHEQARERMAYDRGIAALYDSLLELHARQVAFLEREYVAPAASRFEGGTERYRKDRVLAGRLFHGDVPQEERVAGLERMREEALEVLRADVLEPLRKEACVRKFGEAGDAWARELAEWIEARPDVQSVHALQDPAAERVSVQVEVQEVRTRFLARRALDAFALESLRQATNPLVEALRGAERQATTVAAGAIRSGIAMALEIVDEADGEAGADEVPANGSAPEPASGSEAAGEAAMNGFRIAADTLHSSAGMLQAALPPCVRGAHEVYARGWKALHQRLRVRDRMRGQLLDLQTEWRGRAAGARRDALAFLRRSYLRTLVRLRSGFRWGSGLFRRGRKLVAGEVASVDEVLPYNLELVTRQNQRLSGLPDVYRRMFSARPVTDPALLGGREDDLAWVDEHVRQWRAGWTNAIVVVAHSGSGHTSFLNGLRATSLADAEVRTLDMPERITRASDFARAVAGALELPESAGRSLEALAEAVRQLPPADRFRACLVERIEHVLLRTVDGLDLIREVLTFFSQTDAHVLWIATATPHGWHLIEKAEHVAARLVVVHRLSLLDRQGVERVILRRHERAGLGLRFVEPAEPTSRLRSLLRQAASDDDRQRILRSVYFDRLAALSGQDLTLAMFYWLRSLEVDPGRQGLIVHPVQALKFTFLETLESPQSLILILSLRAFLEHVTLTLEEHDRIFRCTREESVAVFEALANLLLIVPDGEGGDVERLVASEIRDDRRYRIRPLVMHPVVDYLQRNHMVY